MLQLMKGNYYSRDANKEYFSASQFKAFDRCEEAAFAEMLGLYQREETDALLIGSYVDAHFSGETAEFVQRHPDMLTKKGELYAKYKHADEIIARIESEPLMMEYLTGEKQKILTAELFGIPWKCKLDIWTDQRIVDLKIVKDFEPIYEKGFGYRPWVEYWGYDIQGAIYQRVEQIVNNRPKPLPFYIVAATKEKVPDVAVIHVGQEYLNAALKVVEAKIDRFVMIKDRLVPPRSCGRCDWCKVSKTLEEPEEYDNELC